MAQDRVVETEGFRLIIRNGSLSRELGKAALKGLDKLSKNYAQQIKRVISLDDHTLAELRQLGHPYSTSQPPNSFHGDDRLVHEQSGDLVASIHANAPEAETSRTYYVSITSDSPYMPYLVYGTSTMRPRNFPELAYEQIKDSFWKPLEEALRNVEYRIEVGSK